jgi:hypothetical protein
MFGGMQLDVGVFQRSVALPSILLGLIQGAQAICALVSHRLGKRMHGFGWDGAP